MLTRPDKSEAEAEAEAEARGLALQHKIYQYQKITPSVGVTTVSMHYSKLTSIEYHINKQQFPIRGRDVNDVPMPRPDATGPKPRSKILASRPHWPRGLNIPEKHTYTPIVMASYVSQYICATL